MLHTKFRENRPPVLEEKIFEGGFKSRPLEGHHLNKL